MSNREKKLVMLAVIVVIIGSIYGIVKLLNKDKDIYKDIPITEPDDNPEVIPVYLTTEQALNIAKPLYEKAEKLINEVNDYEAFNKTESDEESYDLKILNYNEEVLKVFKEMPKINPNFFKNEDGSIYVNTEDIKKKNGYLGTELQIRENDIAQITFNAVTKSCLVKSKPCTDSELADNTITTTNDFTIVKDGETWKILKYTLPY